jgi:hypothetical protein
LWNPDKEIDLKFLTRTLLASLLLVSGTALAEGGAEAQAEALLDTLGMEAAFVKSIDRMLDVQLQQQPALAPYKQVLLGFLEKYMSYESLKADLVEIYAGAFTEGELRNINDFYKTETGQKAIKVMPELMARGAQLGMQRVQANSAELQDMLKAEAERIQELQSQ